MPGPLSDVQVIDFSTLLPGPLATLMLAEAGATVTRIESPTGDALRRYTPALDHSSIDFALLNRGKRSVSIDLKQPGAAARLHPLIGEAQILVEQFRPRVMARLGLGYAQVRAINPRIVYCSITGYGQHGPKADRAAHDLNCVADTGMLGDRGEAPALPAALVADIGGGAFPALINILLALRHAERTGEGCHLDLAMTDALFCWQHRSFGHAALGLPGPAHDKGMLSGGSARYQLYRTADDRFVAAAPLEDRFWQRFCELIALPASERDDARDPEQAIAAVAAIIASRPAAAWQTVFAGHDVCCSIVVTLEEALQDPHFRRRGLLAHQLRYGEQQIMALPVPIAKSFRDPGVRDYPQLGQDNALLED